MVLSESTPLLKNGANIQPSNSAVAAAVAIYIPPSGGDRNNNSNNNNNRNANDDASKPATSIYIHNNNSSTIMDVSRNSWASDLSSSMRQFSTRLQAAVVQHTGSIGTLGSISIAVNSITGPAMLTLPATFGRSGIVPTVLTLLVVGLLCSFSSLHTANAISKVGFGGGGGNHNFTREVEFSDVFRAFGLLDGRRGYLLTQFLFWGCVTCLNISSIVDTAQVVDTFLGHWFPRGGTAAIWMGRNHSGGDDDNNNNATVQWLRWDYSVCTPDELRNGLCVPFDEWDEGHPGGVLITAGKVVVTIVFFPLALLDLKENAAWQVLAFAILLVTSVQFVVQFAQFGLEPSYLSWWGHDWDDLLGVVLFNFPLVLAVPAWLYEREPHVDVPTVVHSSTALSVILYVAIGLLGAMALPNVSENMIESMLSGAMGTTMQLGASIFAFAIVGLGIPLFSVLVRLNLTGAGLCSRPVGNILAVYVPFGVSLLLPHGGETVSKLLSYGGVAFTSLVAFILPLVLALHVANEYGDYEGSVSVYFGKLKDKRSERISLRILLAVAVFSVLLAILGNIVDYDQ